MKRLIIATAIVCTVALSHAATYQWSWKGTVMDGYNKVAGSTYTAQTVPSGTMYIFNGNDVSQQTVLSAFIGGTDWTSGALDNTNFTDGAAPGNPISIPEADIGTLRQGTGTSSDKQYVDYFYALVNTAENAIYLTKNNSAQVQLSKATDLNSTVLITSQVNNGELATFGDAGWYTKSTPTPTPEPTSGLLLILGVAGLALRRKHA